MKNNTEDGEGIIIIIINIKINSSDKNKIE
jgi:hypothetical protein